MSYMLTDFLSLQESYNPVKGCHFIFCSEASKLLPVRISTEQAPTYWNELGCMAS